MPILLGKLLVPLPRAKPLPRAPRRPPLAEPPRLEAEDTVLPSRPGIPIVRVDGRGVVSLFGVAFEIVEGGLSTKEVSVVMNVVSPSKSSL